MNFEDIFFSFISFSRLSWSWSPPWRYLWVAPWFHSNVTIRQCSCEWNGRLGWSLVSLLFSLKDRKLNRKKISSSCGHKGAAFLSSLIIDGREKLVVACQRCDDLKLLDLQTGGWSTAFTGCKSRALCSGGSGTIFVQSRGDRSILQLDATSSVFKGPVRTLHTDIYSMAMCYIPPPVNALVLSDGFSSKMFALSVERDALLWEFQHGGVYHHSEEVVWDRTGLLFHPEYNVLLVADGFRNEYW